MKKILLLIPGLPRTGSTFLFNLLCQHDMVLKSKVKETAFFHDHLDFNNLSKPQFLENFNNFLTKERIYIDGTVTYFLDKNYIKKALLFCEEFNLELKIILLNRPKYERAKSQYFHEKLRSEHSADFITLIEQEFNDIEKGLDTKTSFFIGSNYEKMTNDIKSYIEEDSIFEISFEDLFKESTILEVEKFLKITRFPYKYDDIHKNESIPIDNKLFIFLKFILIKIRNLSPLFFEKKIFRSLYNRFHKLFGQVSKNKSKYNKDEKEIFLKLYSKIKK